ncbi:MAG: DUF305 domain-containing protein [Micavibrio sp.]|nr:DUF305 domain-containing protein [Micavibrio sp.]
MVFRTFTGSLLLLGTFVFAYGQAPVSSEIVQPGAPGQPTHVLPADTHPVAHPATQQDIEFMQGMVMHHGQALEMTELIPSHTTNEQVRQLGARIHSSQSDEIEMMKRWLRSRGQPISMAMPGMPEMDMSGKPMAPMPGMLTPEQMDALRKARGAEFDRLFLSGMIQHHTGALVMVKDLFAAPGAGQDADVFNFATDVDNTQRAEIRLMQQMLSEEKKEKL